MKRTGTLKRKTPLRTKSPMKRVSKKRPKRTSLGIYKPPAWFNRIKPGSHGSTPAMKRLWRVVSETYRESDFELHGPYCPCCGLKFDSWRDGQLGHWLRYSICNSWFKFSRFNMALICAGCNMKDDAVTLKKLGEALQFRYGDEILDWIEAENKSYSGRKIETWAIVDYVAKLRPDLVEED